VDQTCSECRRYLDEGADQRNVRLVQRSVVAILSACAVHNYRWRDPLQFLAQGRKSCGAD
jgi:hypothetical protein